MTVIAETTLIDDMHIHLRQDDVMDVVVPHLLEGAIGRCIVMPNTIPPITSIKQAVEYRQKLQTAYSRVHKSRVPDFKMLLFLCPELSPEVFDDCPDYIIGVKSYPRGVTTNSSEGVESYEQFYPLFRKMEKNSKSLHIHGETPKVDPFEAEQSFLPTFERMAKSFPKLKLVLEHVSSKEGVEMVERLGDNVAATITPQHLLSVAEDVFEKELLASSEGLRASGVIRREDVCNPHLFCKPAVKFEADREAIQRVVLSGNPKFFFGSDSAPHLKSSKLGLDCAIPAGCYSSPVAADLLVEWAVERNAVPQVMDFMTLHGHRFFGMDPPVGSVVFKMGEHMIPSDMGGICPMRGGSTTTVVKTVNN